MGTVAATSEQARLEFMDRINNEKNEAEKIKLQLNYLLRFVNEDREKARKVAIAAVRQAKKLNLHHELAEGYRLQAMYEISSGNVKAAVKHVSDAEKYARLVNDEAILSGVYRIRYLISIMSGNIPEGIDNITKCIAIAERIGGEIILMSAYVNIAELIANHVQDYDRTIEYLKKSLAIATKLNKPYTKSGALTYLADVYILKREFAKGKKLIDEALRIIRKNNFGVTEVRALVVLGNYYQAVKKYRAALKEFKAAEVLSLQRKEGAMLQFIYANQAQLYFLLNDFKSAEKYIHKSNKYGNENQSLLENKNLKALHSKILAKRGQYKKAWLYLMESDKMKDEIYREEAKKKVQIIAKAHQSEILKKEKTVAEENARQRKDFLANMSHEIRSPMNAVLGIANILLRRNPDNENTGYLRTIISSTESLLNVVNDILDISKIDAGKLEMVNEEFLVQQAMQNVFTTLQYKTNEKAIGFTTLVDEKLAAVYSGDRHRLQQVLMNLAGNAIKFTSKGTISIEAKLVSRNAAGDTILFRVTDTGTGMSAEQLSRVFERFEQAENITAAKFGGTGLGLSISQKIVELMGGKIYAESEIGKGSVFSFEVKLKPVLAPRQAADGGLKHYLEGLKGKTFLIADDNKVNLEVLGQTIADNLPGSDIVSASNGQEVLDELQKRSFDFLVTDLQMPVLDGFRTVKQIKLQPDKHTAMRIVALAATIAFTSKEELEKMGFNAWMNKPFKEEELFRTLHSVL